MLKEVVPTRQIPDEPRRVWYLDDDMDLIAWFADDQTVIGFQMCDNKGPGEHALTWFGGKGFSYERVDDGEGRPGRVKMTPILLHAAVPDIPRLSRLFREKSHDIPAPLREFVQTKLLEYEEPPDVS